MAELVNVDKAAEIAGLTAMQFHNATKKGNMPKPEINPSTGRPGRLYDAGAVRRAVARKGSRH